MPYGVELDATGARFRLWAPGARAVDVIIGEHVASRHSLAPGERGWFEAQVEGVRTGARYRFRIDDRIDVPDPASRCNPDGVHAPSAIVDPLAYEWRDGDWRGRPWREAVIYELHVGTFTASGTFASAIERLDPLVDLGVTAIELMPVAAFAGDRNWGYDGVLPFAPAACYGTPDDLKRLVDAAHARELMVLLDVVYNHFGPDGNYLNEYAPLFFDSSRHTPWGAAINFDGDGCADVRAFFVHNACYWIEEFRFDGLRLDALHAIADTSRPDIVEAIASAVRTSAGADRHVHIVLENDRNQARYLERDAAGRAKIADAQWNDDVHHALHVLATGETEGYYAEFSDRPLERLGRALAEGFAWQGERSPWRNDTPRGEPSAHLATTAFVDFTQTHDQVGNRAFGERLVALGDEPAVRAAVACVLLAPAVPMLFMGEEFAASSPFLFFCDFRGDLASAVTRGRREEFGRLRRFRDRAARESIPDPNARSTFEASKLDWSQTRGARGVEWLAYYRALLAIRRERIVPLLDPARATSVFDIRDGRLLRVTWTLRERATLQLAVNFSLQPIAVSFDGDRLFATDAARLDAGELAPLGVVCILGRAR